MTLYDFIKNRQDNEKVVISYEWNTYRMYIKDLKTEESKKQKVIGYILLSDLFQWYVANDVSYPGIQEDPTGKYLFISICDNGEE